MSHKNKYVIDHSKRRRKVRKVIIEEDISIAEVHKTYEVLDIKEKKKEVLHTFKKREKKEEKKDISPKFYTFKKEEEKKEEEKEIIHTFKKIPPKFYTLKKEEEKKEKKEIKKEVLHTFKKIPPPKFHTFKEEKYNSLYYSRDKCKNLANLYHGEFLESKSQLDIERSKNDNNVEYWWKCKWSHVFKNSPEDINLRGFYCPDCERMDESEYITNNDFFTAFSIIFNKSLNTLLNLKTIIIVNMEDTYCAIINPKYYNRVPYPKANMLLGGTNKKIIIHKQIGKNDLIYEIVKQNNNEKLYSFIDHYNEILFTKSPGGFNIRFYVRFFICSIIHEMILEEKINIVKYCGMYYSPKKMFGWRINNGKMIESILVIIDKKKIKVNCMNISPLMKKEEVLRYIYNILVKLIVELKMDDDKIDMFINKCYMIIDEELIKRNV